MRALVIACCVAFCACSAQPKAAENLAPNLAQSSATPPSGQSAVTGKKSSLKPATPPGGQSAVTGKKSSAQSITKLAQQPSWPSFEELLAEPNSLAKDFYLNEFFAAKILSAEQLKTARAHIYRYAGKIAKNYELQVPPNAEPAAASECFNYGVNDILKAPFACLKTRLSELNFAQKFTPAQLKKIAKIYAKTQPDFAQMLEIYAAKSPERAAISKGAGELALRLHYAGKKLPDLPLGPLGQRSFLASANAYKFLNSALVNNDYAKLRKSLLNQTQPSKKMSYDLAFAMGINGLEFGHKTTAKKYFLHAARAAKFKRPRDNALFFAYLAGREKALLKQLAASEDLNIYSLYARELLGAKGYEVSVPQPTAELANEPISDALAQARWQREINSASREKLLEYEKKYYARNTLGQYLALRTKLFGYSENIYPMPFAEHLADASKEERALLYAIAMQESRFLPASVSTSYALGMMQFMPFVARHTAKADFGMEDFDVTKMFEPSTALPFALAHIRMLRKSVNSALFVAYAYNGGIGFTRRMLANGWMFSARSRFSKYEPFISMELVPYAESRLYGKKVLANYYVYKNLLGERVSMRELFAALEKHKDAELVDKSKEQK